MRKCLPVLLVGAVALSPCTSREPGTLSRGPVAEGYATMEDGVRLYYRSVGEGPEVVVVPMAVYLAAFLEPLASNRRVVFYDPRNRGRSDAGDLNTVSLDQQIEDLEELRKQLGIERMALIGFSGLGMEMAAYVIQYPERVTRLVQVSPIPPAAEIPEAVGGDTRGDQQDREAVRALEARWEAGEFDQAQEQFCRKYNRLTLPTSLTQPWLLRSLMCARSRTSGRCGCGPILVPCWARSGDMTGERSCGNSPSHDLWFTAEKTESRLPEPGHGSRAIPQPDSWSFLPQGTFRSWNSVIPS